MQPITSLPSRKVIAAGSASLLCGALVFLAGCASEPESHVVSSPPPPAPTATMAVTAPAPTTTTVATPVAVANTPNGAVVITQAPPAVVPEAVTARPSSEHVWVSGYWTWRNSRYEWMAGHWEVPPRTDAKWVPPRWEPERGAFRFYEGYWN